MKSTELKIVKAYIKKIENQRLIQVLMTFRDDFESLCGSILHRNPLHNVDSVVNELLAEEIRLKTHYNVIQNKGILYTPPSVFAASIHKWKYQGRIGLDINECDFCKKKGHWKSQCPEL